MRFVLSIALVLVLSLPVAAAEAEIDAAYQSYREEMREGDLRAALPYAQSAFENANAEWGEGAPETYRYAGALARVQNDLYRYESALQTVLSALQGASAKDTNQTQTYDVFFQAGRAARGVGSNNTALTFFRRALEIAEQEYGESHLRAAYAHMELARSFTDTTRGAAGDQLRHRLIGSGNPQVAGDTESFDRAVEIFRSRDRSIEIQIMEAIRAGNLMAANDMSQAGDVLEPAIENLVSNGYIDDYVLGLFVDWVGSHLARWPARRMERMLLQAHEYGSLRREGQVISLARTMGVRNRRACVDRVDGGEAVVEYSVDTNGQVPRTRILETNMPSWWRDEQRETMRSWVFIPARQNGQNVRIDGIQLNINITSC